ncbi:hypothetical protein WAH98_21890, partial [Acinetobacter baumannii]
MSYIAADLTKLAGRPTCYQARLYSKKPGELNDVSYSINTSCSKGEVRLAFGVTTEQSAIDEMRKTKNVKLPE